MSDNAIEIKGLTKSFKKVKVLEGINLSVERGTMLALLGPNGAGKTTTVRILSTLLKPDAGEVRVNGFDVVGQADEVRRTIGLTGQYAAVDELLTGRENLIMMGRLYHLGIARAKSRAEELLTQFDLTDAADRAAKTYSGGMRRRLDLAASLVAIPPVLFLDEPTTGLDPRSRITMWNVIRGLMDSGATILLTTQYLEEADKLADRIAVLDHGVIIAEGTAKELKSRVGNERLELIIGERSNLEEAIKVLPNTDLQIHKEERRISIPAGGVADVSAALTSLQKAGIDVESLSLHRPTLDEVFLTLTGKEVTEEETKS